MIDTDGAVLPPPASPVTTTSSTSQPVKALKLPSMVSKRKRSWMSLPAQAASEMGPLGPQVASEVSVESRNQTWVQVPLPATETATSAWS